MLKQPEYSDADSIKNIISKFEDENLIKNIEEKDNGVILEKKVNLIMM